MDFCKEGNYTKYSNLKGNVMLTFIPKNEDDNYTKVLNMIKQINPRFCAFQCCRNDEKLDKFKTLYYVKYSAYGKILNYPPIVIKFDFENNKILVNNKSYKIKKDYTYTYKIQKTQIKAVDGIEGFYKFIIQSMNCNDIFHSSVYESFNKICC